jgi:hypothetical protein
LHSRDKRERLLILIGFKVRAKLRERLEAVPPRSVLLPNPDVNNKRAKRLQYRVEPNKFLPIKKVHQTSRALKNAVRNIQRDNKNRRRHKSLSLPRYHSVDPHEKVLIVL